MTTEAHADRLVWPDDAEAAERPRRRWLPFSPWHLVLFPLAMIMLLPLVWMIVTSLQTQAESLRFPPVLVTEHPASSPGQSKSTAGLGG